MTSMFQSFWTGALRPLLQRPPALQVAALCHRQAAQGIEVLLVTSSSGRWILPKGWPIDGMTAAQAAQQEAWEEAGVKQGQLSNTAIGSILSEKRFDNGATVSCEIQVYEIAVETTLPDYPEADSRQRKWVSIKEACALIDEPELRQLLKGYAAA